MPGKSRWSALAAALALVSCGGNDAPESTRPELVLVGIDGATWDVIDPMLARGELPNLAKLIERGLRGPLLSLPPLSSPVVWTTIATGRHARDHGILGFTYPFSDTGQGRPVRSDMRREPAIWNVAAEHGKSAGVVGWFVSHPPEIVDGFTVSDRMHQGVPGSTSPDVLSLELLEAMGEGAPADELMERFLPWDYRPEAADDPSDPNHTASLVVRGRVDEVILRDEAYRRMTLALADIPVDLFACYFRIIDHASHATWRYFDDSEFDEPADPHDAALLGDIVPEAYRWVDDLVGELVERFGEDANLVLVSDHGFGPATKDYEVTEGKGMVLSGSHRVNGIFLAAGPDFARGEIGELTILEVTPILLALLELPISDELDGRFEKGVFRQGFLEEHPPRRVPAYDVGWSFEGDGVVSEEAEEEALDTLKGLGYIGDELEVGAADTLGELDFWATAPGIRDTALTGEVLHHVLKGDGEGARAVLELVREHDADAATSIAGRALNTLGAMERALGKEPGALANPEVLRAAGIVP